MKHQLKLRKGNKDSTCLLITLIHFCLRLSFLKILLAFLYWFRYCDYVYFGKHFMVWSADLYLNSLRTSSKKFLTKWKSQEDGRSSNNQTPHSRGKRIDVVGFIYDCCWYWFEMLFYLLQPEKRLFEKDWEIFASQMSRYLFPLLFALFNIFYWSHYLNQVFTLSIV